MTTSATRNVTVSNGTAHATIVALQFDDGDADQYQVRSMLTSHGMDATFYINSGRIGASGYMTLSQIQDLAADGNEIAGHTVTHADLPTLDGDEAARQVCNDRVALLNLGFSVRSFAYPYGSFNNATKTIVSGCGYNNARTIGGLVTPTRAPAARTRTRFPRATSGSFRRPTRSSAPPRWPRCRASSSRPSSMAAASFRS